MLGKLIVDEFEANDERLDGSGVDSVAIKMVSIVVGCGPAIVDNTNALLALQGLYPSLTCHDERDRTSIVVGDYADTIGKYVNEYVGARGALLATGVPMGSLALYDLHVDDVVECDVKNPFL
jgi:hypothetical protein